MGRPFYLTPFEVPQNILVPMYKGVVFKHLIKVTSRNSPCEPFTMRGSMSIRGCSLSVTLSCLVIICFMTAGCSRHASEAARIYPSKDDRGNLLAVVAKELAVPGVVFAELDRDTDIPQIHAAGLADLDAKTPMRGDMAFHVGSVTKSFTATAILMLADRGLLKLDDVVDTYLPGQLPGGDKITIRNLLMMRSGLTDYHTTKGFAEIIDTTPQHVWSFAELASLVEVNDNPDEYFEYRNINYITLGAILEKVSGRSRADFVSEEICKPLGLTRTFVPASADMPAHSARGYVPTNEGHEDVSEEVHPSWAGAAGDMVSTARDIVVWLKALSEGTLLSEARHKDMFSMRGAHIHGGFGGYGQGTLNLFGAVGHGGDYSGIYTAAMFEYQGRYVVTLVNGQKQEDGGDATAVFFEMVRSLYPPKDNPEWLAKQLNVTVAMARDRLNVPGMVAKIGFADGTTWTGVAGIAKGDDSSISDTRDWSGLPMSEALKFRIASVSKSVTATAVLQLVDRGILGLDDTLGKWLPEVSIATKDEVTIRQLLNHTSGIPDFIRNKAFFELNFETPLRKWTLAERIAYGVPVVEPGSTWAYSNTGYILLGQIIEAASGQSYGDYLERNIFAPLGMKDSSVPDETDFSVPTPHANGYTFNFNQMAEIPDDMPKGGWLKDQTDSNWQGLGYGNIIATPGDLLTWLQALTDGRLLSQESMKEMHRYEDTGTPGFGYGLGVENHHGYIGHDGDLPGYHAGAYSKNGHAFTVLMNGDSFFGRGFEVVQSLGAVLGL